MNKSTLFLFPLLSVAFLGCVDATDAPVVDVSQQQTVSTSSYTVGGGTQNRVANTGYYGSESPVSRSLPAEMPNGITVPVDAVDITQPNFNRNASVYYIPEGATFSGTIPDNFNGSVYVAGTLKNIGNNLSRLDLYILESGEVIVEWEPNGNNINIFNEGVIHFKNNITYSRIQNIYNSGAMIVDGGISSNALKIYSDGYIELNGQWPMDFQPQIIADHLVQVNGSLRLQTQSSMKDVCGYVATGTIEVIADNTVGYLKADVIRMDGHHIVLKPESHVEANTIVLNNSNTGFFLQSESVALVECNELTWQNNTLASKFGQGVYLNVNTINGLPLTGEEQISTHNGINNSTSISGIPSCGAPWGTSTKPQSPRLDLIAEVLSPEHNHDKNKGDDTRRLSATSVAVNGNDIYVSYHMRGSNWANDSYDIDETEGCIEKWTLVDQGVKLGNWMWTHEFDFNHIIFDLDCIVTVGHKSNDRTDVGAIIGRLPLAFASADNLTDIKTQYNDFGYRFITTEVYDKSLGDYKSAGDGNCVVKSGDKYYVATSQGYGILDVNFAKIKETEVLFTTTPGSAKYIVPTGNDFAVLHLNSRPEAKAQKDSAIPATVATVSKSLDVVSQSEVGIVSPVDGKNVVAVDNGVVYACLGRNGLYVSNGLSYDAFHGPVNCVYVDDRFVYVANGVYITVLDKQNLSLVAERKCYIEGEGDNNTVSSNFVRVVGDKVFVAFGQAGIKVFELHLN